MSTATGCSQDVQNGLWHAAPAYSPARLFAVGFYLNIPSFDNVKSGAARLSELTTDTAALVLCGYAYFARAGDQIHFNITGKNGFAIKHTQGIDKTQLHLFRAFGKRRPKAG